MTSTTKQMRPNGKGGGSIHYVNYTLMTTLDEQCFQLVQKRKKMDNYKYFYCFHFYPFYQPTFLSFQCFDVGWVTERVSVVSRIWPDTLPSHLINGVRALKFVCLLGV